MSLSPLGTSQDDGALFQIDALDAQEVRVYTLETGDREQVRTATRRILSQLSAVRFDLVAFDYGPKGKPYCRTDPAVRFSVSHADTVSLVAVTSVSDVGVDIEAIRDVPRAAAIARRFFPPDQVDSIFGGEHGPEQFARAWTAAEATVKVRGASIWEAGTPDPSVTTRELVAPAGYAATVAVATPAFDVVQVSLNLTALQLV